MEHEGNKRFDLLNYNQNYKAFQFTLYKYKNSLVSDFSPLSSFMVYQFQLAQ